MFPFGQSDRQEKGIRDTTASIAWLDQFICTYVSAFVIYTNIVV